MVSLPAVIIGAGVVLDTPLLAGSPQQTACEGSGGKWSGGKCAENTSNGPAVAPTIKNIIDLLLFVAGLAAVIVIVVSGLRFVTANGDSQKVTSARNGIVYAAIGLIVAIMAYAIVNFILDNV